MIEGSGSVPLTSGSGSGRSKTYGSATLLHSIRWNPIDINLAFLYTDPDPLARNWQQWNLSYTFLHQSWSKTFKTFVTGTTYLPRNRKFSTSVTFLGSLTEYSFSSHLKIFQLHNGGIRQFELFFLHLEWLQQSHTVLIPFSHAIWYLPGLPTHRYKLL